MRALTERQWDVLQHKGMTVTLAKTPRAHRTCDVSQSSHGCSVILDSISCATPLAQIYSEKRHRLLIGHELMRAQGIVYPEPQATLIDEMAFDKIGDLAGNAFECHCCTSALLTGLCGLALVHCNKLPSQEPPLRRPESFFSEFFDLDDSQV